MSVSLGRNPGKELTTETLAANFTNTNFFARWRLETELQERPGVAARELHTVAGQAGGHTESSRTPIHSS